MINESIRVKPLAVGLRVRKLMNSIDEGKSVNGECIPFKSTIDLFINNELVVITLKPVKSAITVNIDWCCESLKAINHLRECHEVSVASVNDELILTCNGRSVITDLRTVAVWIPRTTGLIQRKCIPSYELVVKASRIIKLLAEALNYRLAQDVLETIKLIIKDYANISIRNYPEFLRELIKLLGLGEGLTPSVDDFFLAAASAYNLLVRTEVIKGEEFMVGFKELIKRTNTLSAKLIIESLSGSVNEGIDGAVYSYLLNNYEGLINSLLTLLSLGHTSGLMQVLGTLLTLCLLSGRGELGECATLVMP